MTTSCDNCGTPFNCSPSNLIRYKKHYCSKECKHIGEQEFCPDILTFQRKLFERPITELAEEYKISVKTIHKFINNNNLRRPSRGFWQKVAAGKIDLNQHVSNLFR